MRTFDIVLTGRTLPGFEANSVVAALASTLRLPEEKARELLAGRETVIKRGLAEDQLPPYVEALRKCGAEVRSREPVPDTVKCPACGAEQPPRNLCRQCGADMKRVAAAQGAANSAPKQAAVAVPAAASRVTAPVQSETPLYRRNLFVEFLFFFFLSPYWGWKAMTDSERGKFTRAFGGIVLVGSSVQIFLLVNEIRKYGWMGEDGPTFAAVQYTIATRKQVDEFVAANRRLPERGEIRAGDKPASVETVEIGPAGRVRVVLSSGSEKSAGGSLVLTPYVDAQGGMGWECQAAGIDAPWLAKNCTMK